MHTRIYVQCQSPETEHQNVSVGIRNLEEYIQDKSYKVNELAQHYSYVIDQFVQYLS